MPHSFAAAARLALFILFIFGNRQRALQQMSRHSARRLSLTPLGRAWRCSTTIYAELRGAGACVCWPLRGLGLSV